MHQLRFKPASVIKTWLTYVKNSMYIDQKIIWFYLFIYLLNKKYKDKRVDVKLQLKNPHYEDKYAALKNTDYLVLNIVN